MDFSSSAPSTKQIENPVYGCHDSMRHGLRSISSELEETHPLEHALRSSTNPYNISSNLTLKQMAFGAGAVEMYKRDLAAVSTGKRMGGLRSTCTLQRIVEGTDCELDFSDYLAQTMPLSINEMRL